MSAAERADSAAPFPARRHREAAPAFPARVPAQPQADRAEMSRLDRQFSQTQWPRQSMMAIGAQDPVLGVTTMMELHQFIRGCPPPLLIEQAGHFVQEHGETIAQSAVAHFS